MDWIDLRSDTVTQPTPEMRQAMADAPLGDDVYGEDPTVNRLQEMSAELLGKDAGLFVPSGTMGNLSAILAQCHRGDEVILGDKAHTFLFEAGGISALGGVHSCQLSNQPDGTLRLDDIETAIRPDNVHHPITRLISLETTHNRCGGVAIPVEYMRMVYEFSREHSLWVHLDGARLFNAATALNLDAKELVEYVDSVTFCLSKGLCAPVGSILCGPKEFIQRAHRIRKQLGGGMRQVGVLAAAGIIAIEKMISRLDEDHDKALRLAQGLSSMPGLILDEGTPHTNMIFMNLADDFPRNARQIATSLREHGVRISVVGSKRFRLVTHYWIDDLALVQALKAFREVLNFV
jgi:threonine aldolase